MFSTANKVGKTLLHWAVDECHDGIFQRLLSLACEGKFSLEARENKQRRTALHMAAVGLLYPSMPPFHQSSSSLTLHSFLWCSWCRCLSCLRLCFMCSFKCTFLNCPPPPFFHFFDFFFILFLAGIERWERVVFDCVDRGRSRHRSGRRKGTRPLTHSCYSSPLFRTLQLHYYTFIPFLLHTLYPAL